MRGLSLLAAAALAYTHRPHDSQLRREGSRGSGVMEAVIDLVGHASLGLHPTLVQRTLAAAPENATAPAAPGSEGVAADALAGPAGVGPAAHAGEIAAVADRIDAPGGNATSNATNGTQPAESPIPRKTVPLGLALGIAASVLVGLGGLTALAIRKLESPPEPAAPGSALRTEGHMALAGNREYQYTDDEADATVEE